MMIVTNPQSANWGDISWSRWHDLDHARDNRLIPRTAGLYRFRAQGEDGLLYIGESGALWTRLDDLARARRRHPAEYYLQGLGDPGHSSAPYFMLCEEAGCKIEVSWSLAEDPDQDYRRGAEAHLLRLYREAAGEDPPVQHGGRGIAAYLNRRAHARRNTRDEAAQKDSAAAGSNPGRAAPSADAERAARSITNEFFNGDTLTEIAKAPAAGDMNCAKRLIRSITDGHV